MQDKHKSIRIKAATNIFIEVNIGMLSSGMLWHEKSLRILESKYLYAGNDFIYIKQNDAEINKL